MVDGSIVILNWNGRDLLSLCLESVRGAIRASTYAWEVIVVDNASTDGSQELVRTNFPQVILIENPTNLGFAGGVNVGIRRSSGRYVLLLNNDTVVAAAALDALIRIADQRDDAGLVAGYTVGPQGEDHFCGPHSPRYRPNVAELIIQEFLPPAVVCRLKRRLFRRRIERLKATAYIACGFTAASCLMARSSAIAQVGLLDERFFFYFEDKDWCYRFRRAGWTVGIVPEARVVHSKGRSARPERHFVLGLRGKLAWYGKYFPGRYLPLYRLFLAVMALPRLVRHMAVMVRQGRGHEVAGVFKSALAALVTT